MPEFLQQRKIQPDPDRSRIHCGYSLGIALQLGPIARNLGVEKSFQIAAQVPARLVIDDPAQPVGVDEAPVDAQVLDAVLPVSTATETELDLFQEQFLTPLLLDAVRVAFEVLVEQGCDPVPALLDMHASGEMAEMMVEAATVGLYEVIEQQGSPTCRFGVHRHLGTLLGEDDTLTGGEVLPGFAAPVAALFEG